MNVGSGSGKDGMALRKRIGRYYELAQNMTLIRLMLETIKLAIVISVCIDSGVLTVILSC